MLPAPLHLNNVSVKFDGAPALAGFTGTFTPGTVTALIGGDGAGKSTLLRMLAGRLYPDGGASEGLPVPPMNVGYQPADSGVWRNLSVAENIEFAASAYGLDAKQAQDRAAQLLTLAGLNQITSRLAGHLSGGMRQKLGVVLATLHNPDLVLLDEPTTGVDPISRAELWSLIAGAAADGATVVFATTYLDEAERASKLFLLGNGKLLASGTPDEVIARTPGVTWEAPAALEPARHELGSARAWRRANTVYLWTPLPSGEQPEGFKTAIPDLENTSIALLLEQDQSEGIPVPSGDARPPKHQTATDTPLVEAIDVTRVYAPFTAVSDISFEIRAGEVVGLLGGNGAGKTTLMRILLGLEAPSAGTSMLFGEKPSLKTRRRIGTSPKDLVSTLRCQHSKTYSLPQ